jgi:hypothetical protein
MTTRNYDSFLNVSVNLQANDPHMGSAQRLSKYKLNANLLKLFKKPLQLVLTGLEI